VKSPRNILIVVLSAVVLAVAALAWHQYRELIALRAQLAGGDYLSLKNQLAAAQKTIKALEDRIAGLRGRHGIDPAALAGAGEGNDNAFENGPGRRGGRFNAWRAMADNPEFQRLLAIQAKARISQTYGPLFKSLNLSPDQMAQFQTLLADKEQAMMDVMAAARDQGINPRTDPDGFKSLMGQAVSQADSNIQQALGDAAYQQYQQYQQTLPERNVVNSLQQQLSYSQTPLTDDEASQMISLLAQTQPQRAGNGTAGTGNGGDAGPNPMSLMNGGGNARVTNDAVTQASGVLSAPQVAALQQIQLQQQAQQQMQQMMRSANQGGGGSGASAGGAAPAAGSSGGGKG
jgi:hypothetical protein